MMPGCQTWSWELMRLEMGIADRLLWRVYLAVHLNPRPGLSIRSLSRRKQPERNGLGVTTGNQGYRGGGHAREHGDQKRPFLGWWSRRPRASVCSCARRPSCRSCRRCMRVTVFDKLRAAVKDFTRWILSQGTQRRGRGRSGWLVSKVHSQENRACASAPSRQAAITATGPSHSAPLPGWPSCINHWGTSPGESRRWCCISRGASLRAPPLSLGGVTSAATNKTPPCQEIPPGFLCSVSD